MGYTISVDIGGTFTDFCAIKDYENTSIVKTPTTHYDLSMGFLKGIKELSHSFNLTEEEFLNHTETVRYCTTLGTNTLIERTGPKLGLITTKGFEDTIFIGRARSWADGVNLQENNDLSRIQKPTPLISPDMVVGVRERIDSFGQVICPLKREEVFEKLQQLVDRGAMGFVVCLLWSFAEPCHEQMVKEIIEEEYPEDYLGSMPVFLSSDVSPKSGEYTRFITTIVNAYIHASMAEEINKLGNNLRDKGYKNPLMLVHNTGGMKKASRTRAILTHNAGPVAGLHGNLTLGSIYGSSNIIFTDMGGTSFDIGVVSEGRLKSYDFIPVIDRWRTNIPAIEVKSIGAGGGSIAWINTLLDNRLEIGPHSAGSMPGPACYDQGGQEPTVTDADLVLGYVNPDNYLGGKVLLDPDISHEVIEEKIAKPLGIDVFEAAIRIKNLVDASMGQEVFNEVALKGYDPREFMLCACGGAGPTHVCGFAPYLQVKKVIVSPFSPVFGAYGASTVNIQQVWDKSKTMKIFNWETYSYSEDIDSFNNIVHELKDLATRDLILEGYNEDQIYFQLELDMRFGTQYNLTKIISPKLIIEDSSDFEQICNDFINKYSSIYSPESIYLNGGINVECFYLTAYIELPSLKFKENELVSSISSKAVGEPREVYWSKYNSFKNTDIYIFEGLRAGNLIQGPAIVEAKETTIVVEPEWQFYLDAYYNATLERI